MLLATHSITHRLELLLHRHPPRLQQLQRPLARALQQRPGVRGCGGGARACVCVRPGDPSHNFESDSELPPPHVLTYLESLATSLISLVLCAPIITTRFRVWVRVWGRGVVGYCCRTAVFVGYSDATAARRALEAGLYYCVCGLEVAEVSSIERDGPSVRRGVCPRGRLGLDLTAAVAEFLRGASASFLRAASDAGRRRMTIVARVCGCFCFT